jgi:hypothetical protein
VNAAWQPHPLAQALQQQIASGTRDQKLSRLPPILTFQSVVEFNVSTSAIVSDLDARLAPNGSELVPFDINRATDFGLLLRPSAETKAARPGASCRRQGRQPRRRLRRSENPRARWRRATSEANAVDPPWHDADDFQGLCHVAVARARCVRASGIVRRLRLRSGRCPSPRREARGVFGLK